MTLLTSFMQKTSPYDVNNWDGDMKFDVVDLEFIANKWNTSLFFIIFTYHEIWGPTVCYRERKFNFTYKNMFLV